MNTNDTNDTKDTKDTKKTKKNVVSLYGKVLESINGLGGVIDDFNGERYKFVDCCFCDECDLLAFCGFGKYFLPSDAVHCNEIPICSKMLGVWKKMGKVDEGMDATDANKDAQTDSVKASDKALDDETKYEVQYWCIDKCWMTYSRVDSIDSAKSDMEFLRMLNKTHNKEGKYRILKLTIKKEVVE